MSEATLTEGALEEETEAGADAARPQKGVPRPFDFRRPQKFHRDHMRALEIVNETFARQVSTILSTTLRTISGVSLSAVEQFAYGDYVDALNNPSLVAVLSVDPLPGAAMLHVPTNLAMGIVDRMLGGTGTGAYAMRPLTDIEEGLMREVVERWLRALGDAYESLETIEPKIVQLESNPQFAQITAPSEMVVVVAFDVRMGTEEGRISLCLPYTALQPILEELAGPGVFAGSAGFDPDAEAAKVRSRLQGIAVDVSVRFEPVALPSRDIVSLREGDVLPLHHPLGAPLTLCADGVPFLRAAAGRRGRRLACVIVEGAPAGAGVRQP